jgi:hypothetical protein
MLDLCTKYYDTFIFNMYGNSIMTCTFIIKQSVWPCACFIEVQVHAQKVDIHPATVIENHPAPVSIW